jgi:hypothetical protein
VRKRIEIPVELRRVEHEIDRFHRANPLMQRSFMEAAWYFMAFCEDMVVKEITTSDTSALQRGAVIADQLVESMKWPLRWLRNACGAGGEVPSEIESSSYRASWDLWKLSGKYHFFESAFTYACAGVTRLELHGREIRSAPDLRDDTQYDAYDRLVNPELLQTPLEADEFLERIAHTVRVSGSKFSYDLSPRIVSEGLDAMQPKLDWKLKLPGEWELGRYRLSDFQRVAGVLYVLAFIHFQARMIAAERGCLALGYSRSLLVMGREELIKRLARYTGLRVEIIDTLVEDLTYGARGILQPDPALQPLISLSKSRYCISPNLILASATERNLIVLLNRLPDEKKAYSRLSQMKESLSRERMELSLQGLGLRFWSGKVPGWDHLADIDLALISDEEKQCLLLELKSFVGPAEVREVIERTEEIERGIQQIIKIREAVNLDPGPLQKELAIDSSYKLTWAVSSETSVGAAYAQRPEVPVARSPHLVRKLKLVSSLAAVCEWLTERRYLPTEGVHYRVVEVKAEIDGWIVPWFGIEPLVEEEYL